MPNKQVVDQAIIDQADGDPISSIHVFYRDGANYKMSRNIHLDRELTEKEIQSLEALKDSDGMIDLSRTPYENITNLFEDHNLNEDDHPFVTLTVWPAKVTYDSEENEEVIVFDESYEEGDTPDEAFLEDADNFLNCLGIATPAPAPIIQTENETTTPRPKSSSPAP